MACLGSAWHADRGVAGGSDKVVQALHIVFENISFANMCSANDSL
jgi:hypothetical protein